VRTAALPPTVNKKSEPNAKRNDGLPGLLSSYLLCGVLIWLATLMLSGCATDPARFPELGDSQPPAPGTNAVAGASPIMTNQSTVTASATNAVTSGGTNSMATLDDTHKLAIGDRLSFHIIEDNEDPKPLSVTDSGDLEVPYIGRYPAVSKTCKQLASELKAELEKEYYYQATVIVAVDVMTKSRGKVYLDGPVRAPGPQDIPSDEVLTLSKAILRAGGFSDFADTHNVKVTRKTAGGGEDRTFVVDVAGVLKKGKTESDLPLEPGDLIYVPERGIRF
jgi:protein involved in polysaccharide export with SLBB domain